MSINVCVLREGRKRSRRHRRVPLSVQTHSFIGEDTLLDTKTLLLRIVSCVFVRTGIGIAGRNIHASSPRESRCGTLQRVRARSRACGVCATAVTVRISPCDGAPLLLSTGLSKWWLLHNAGDV